MMALFLNCPLGIQTATCAIIGNCIDSNNVPLAKRFFSMITKISVSLIAIIAFAIIMTRQIVIAFYTDDEEVQEICMQVFLVVAVNFLFDGL